MSRPPDPDCRPPAPPRLASASSVSSQSRSIATRRRPGGSSGNHSRVSRPAPSGSDNATSGSSSTPLDSSSEPPPMSMLMIRPALHPYQRRTARNVSRDSSTPGQHLQRHPGLRAHPRQHVLGVLGVAHRRGGEGHQLGAAGAGGDLGELVDGGDQLVGAPAGELAGAVDRLGQPQRGLGRAHRRRMPAAAGVDHQQVNRVATHVEHAQSHALNLARAAPGEVPVAQLGSTSRRGTRR